MSSVEMDQSTDTAASSGNEGAPSCTTKNNIVRFSCVDVIEFPYTIGCTPCSSGVPIAASSVAQMKTSVPLEFFEASRPERRPKSDLHISADDRRALLLKSGYAQREISAAAKEATRIRKERSETLRELRSKLQSMVIRQKKSNHSHIASRPTFGAVFRNRKKSTISPNTADAKSVARPTVATSTHLSPIVMSPIKSSRQRSRWATRQRMQPIRFPRRGTSQSSSPIWVVDSEGADQPIEYDSGPCSPHPASSVGSLVSFPYSPSDGLIKRGVFARRQDDLQTTNPNNDPPVPLQHRRIKMKVRGCQQQQPCFPVPSLSPKGKGAVSPIGSLLLSSPHRRLDEHFAADAKDRRLERPCFSIPTLSPKRKRDVARQNMVLSDEHGDHHQMQDQSPKRQRTPTKADARPFVMPRRKMTPPRSPIVASRFY